MKVRHLCVTFMYTEPEIISTNDLSKRSYIKFYFNGERYREYNGKLISLSLNPNRAKTLKERNKLLRMLVFEFKIRLQAGWSPIEVIVQPKPIKEPKPIKSLQELFKEIELDKLNSNLSKRYKSDLTIICNQFLEFLNVDEKLSPPNDLEIERIECFLKKYQKSGTYYMFQRRMLGVFFSAIKKRKLTDSNLILETAKVKQSATLHQIYTKEQILKILGYLKEHHFNLYICCLLTYGCLLRPHQEVRLLRKSHFNQDYSTISLSGFENKGKKVRVVGIPQYIRNEMKSHLDSITNPNSNIFSLSEIEYNSYYFSCAWKRLKDDMIANGHYFKDNQTMYSFRHSAAVDIYERTKDLNALQQLLGHSTMVVTLKYLRGLGLMNSQQLMSYLPVLELV
jgi:integrase